MKVVTYNIWNSDSYFKIRLEQLCKVLINCNADIIGLQEVRNEEVVDYIKNQCQYKYSLWKKYCDENEGLAILSRYPIIFAETNWESGRNVHNSFVLRVEINYKNKKIGITNLHLDYESVLNRENEIVETDRMIERYENSDYELLLGDFNSYPESSVYRYLTGQQSLNNHATNWHDLHKIYASKIGIKPKVTLDFFNNPRWDNQNVIEIPGRFDYIMLKSPYPKENPILNSVHIIGDQRELQVTPSDHYAVVCDIDFI
jgi:endonuclease/exonuclease/phosphatase family metal-dependent hydrolase